MTQRILIKRGTIVDGTGGPAFSADVLVEDDRIAAVSRSGIEPGNGDLKLIDASDRVVCPGFVDIHSHGDLYAHQPDHPAVFEPLVRQGITTFIGGNCGYGVAPVDKERFRSAQQSYLEGVTAQDFSTVFSWSGMGDYLDTLERNGVALNVGMLCPHGLIRLQVTGQRYGTVSDEELEQIASILRRALEQGAFGLSTGLQYFPGMFSDTRELARLGQELVPFDGRFTSHLRSYTSNTVHTALDEVAEVARRTGVHVQVSHVFIVPWKGRLQRPFVELVKLAARHHRIANALVPDRFVVEEMAQLLGHFDDLRRGGLRIGMDVMPTTTGFTHMLAFFPPWVLTGSVEAIVDRLKDPAARRRIIADIEGGQPTWPHDGDNTWSLNFFRQFGYDCARIMAVASHRNRHLQGMRLVEIARERKQHPIDAACDLLLEEERQVLVFGSVDVPEDPFTVRSQYPALSHADVAVATDTILIGFGKPSYLFYGCYPKFLGQHSRERGLVDLETAVRKCTSVPAAAIGLKDRGVLAEGSYADIVIFNPRTINTVADFARPDVFPRGIRHVLINGQAVLDDDEYDPGALAGRVLRRS